jgi:signal transduction histidine kinase
MVGAGVARTTGSPQADDAKRTIDRVASLVLAPSSLGGPASIVLIGALLALSWLIPYASGGANRTGTQWFYIPILLAAARFGYAGAVSTGVAASILAGPLLPTDVALAISQNAGQELTKSVFFVLLGLLMAAIIGRLKTSLAQEMSVVEAERDLAAREAAVISMVSHEFRTPLSVITGTVATAKDPELSRPERDELLDGASEAAQRLETLVSGVLAVAERTKGGHAARRLILLELVLSEVAEDLSSTWGDRIHWKLAGSPVVWADPAAVKPALRAVLDNALKFSPPDSSVSVSALRRPRDVQITVTDSGPGIDPSFLPRAFEAFTQQDDSATREHGGLGIGLFVARTMVESAGGRIELLSLAGGGTAASISLPGARSDLDRVRAEPEEPFEQRDPGLAAAFSRESTPD